MTENFSLAQSIEIINELLVHSSQYDSGKAWEVIKTYINKTANCLEAQRYFAADPADGNFNTFSTLEEAIKAADQYLDMAKDEAVDSGWADEPPQICYGVVLGGCTEVEGSRVPAEEGSDFEEVVDFKLSLLPNWQNGTLLPCPFCGSGVKVNEYSTGTCEVECAHPEGLCCIGGPVRSSKEGAINAWNTRSQRLVFCNINNDERYQRLKQGCIDNGCDVVEETEEGSGPWVRNIRAEKAENFKNEGYRSFSLWWKLVEARAALTNEIIKDDTVVLHFMGSGSSHQVTAGDIRQMVNV